MKNSGMSISLPGIVFGLCVTFWVHTFINEYWLKETSVEPNEPPKTELTFPRHLEAKARYDSHRQKLIYKGPMFLSSKEDLLRVSKEEENAVEGLYKKSQAYKNAVEELYKKSQWDKYDLLGLLFGVLFLADLLCVLWWYENYIYRIQPHTNLTVHFLDFCIAGLFTLAAYRWNDISSFLLAAFFATILLISRFLILFRSPNAFKIDEYILLRAFGLLAMGFPIMLVGFTQFYAIVGGAVSRETILTFIPGILAILGIILTLRVRDKVLLSAELHEAATRHFAPMEMCWPGSLDNKQKFSIFNAVNEGLKDFEELFRESRRGWIDKILEIIYKFFDKTYEPGHIHDKLKSRVHAESDLQVQSCILAISSLGREEEIKNKALMVGVSHWLDDLLDGRGEVEVFKKKKIWEILSLN